MPLLLERGIILAIALSLLAAGCGSNDNGKGESSGQAALEFVANPSTVTVGANTWLSWSGHNATSCQASDGWSGQRPASGGFRTPPLTKTTTYTLNCTGPRSGSLARVTVVVSGDAPGAAEEAPQVSLRSQLGSIPSNGSTVLEWTAPMAQQCTASGGWSGTKANRGSQKIAGLKADSTFTLSCEGPGGTGIAMTQMMVQRATLRWAGSASSHSAFRILWGKRADQPENQITVSDPKARERVIDLPGAGTYYFILATLDATNKELSRSNTASKILPP